MPYVEEEQPNLSSLLWVQEEDNQFVRLLKNAQNFQTLFKKKVPMTHNRVPLDLITFKPIEQNSQQIQRNTNEQLIQTTTQLMNTEIKQEEDAKIKLEEEEINGAPNNVSEVKQEQHMRPQMWRQSSESRQHLSSQQSDRPRGAKRKPSYQRRDSWWSDNRDRDQDRDGMRGDPRNERGDRGRNQDNRRGRQPLRNRGRDWDRGRDRDHRERDREWEYNRPHTDLDRPEEGELVDIDFASFSAGMNRGDNNHSARKQQRLD
ncbi:6563_t:CDS:2 [Dentiscutata heterogama]|uniref:6563_t:CDS:1 n=1 Tax=Dentiscutata heterogama TaxID=1316150 RepID=A0ACA9NR58_9GLOM|nr:6563_t:CDS:2 [Dentiscutata heterogama]